MSSVTVDEAEWLLKVQGLWQDTVLTVQLRNSKTILGKMSCEKNRCDCYEIWHNKAIFSRVALADATARPVEVIALLDGQHLEVALSDATARPVKVEFEELGEKRRSQWRPELKVVGQTTTD